MIRERVSASGAFQVPLNGPVQISVQKFRVCIPPRRPGPPPWGAGSLVLLTPPHKNVKGITSK